MDPDNGWLDIDDAEVFEGLVAAALQAVLYLQEKGLAPVGHLTHTPAALPAFSLQHPDARVWEICVDADATSASQCVALLECDPDTLRLRWASFYVHPRFAALRPVLPVRADYLLTRVVQIPHWNGATLDEPATPYARPDPLTDAAERNLILGYTNTPHLRRSQG